MLIYVDPEDMYEAMYVQDGCVLKAIKINVGVIMCNNFTNCKNSEMHSDSFTGTIAKV